MKNLHKVKDIRIKILKIAQSSLPQLKTKFIFRIHLLIQSINKFNLKNKNLISSKINKSSNNSSIASHQLAHKLLINGMKIEVAMVILCRYQMKLYIAIVHFIIILIIVLSQQCLRLNQIKYFNTIKIIIVILTITLTLANNSSIRNNNYSSYNYNNRLQLKMSSSIRYLIILTFQLEMEKK